jgi:hypothetical protein
VVYGDSSAVSGKGKVEDELQRVMAVLLASSKMSSDSSGDVCG